MKYEAIIGLEVHAELATNSKMYCSCPVVDSTRATPNSAVCPVCCGLPGVLPVVNEKAVEYAARVGLALECEIAPMSLFARKNYFYPDLPKGYQISQYEYPLCKNGRLTIYTSQGEKVIRITRAHLEEDTGKLTHVDQDGSAYSLIDLNRAGVPLLEIVTEPDMRSVEEVRAYAQELRAILRYLGVNSGDMEKGVIRFEANVSVRPEGSQELNTRVEIKNLNSFRALERATAYQIEQQIAMMERGEPVRLETLGWDETNEVTFSQRSKEEAHDYRYFPEPDLPPLVVDAAWVEAIASTLPELPRAKAHRFIRSFGVAEAIAEQLIGELAVANYFEEVLRADPALEAQMVGVWITGELFAWMNQSGETIETIKVTPASLAALLQDVKSARINANTAKSVLSEMLRSGRQADDIIRNQGLEQISDSQVIARLVRQTLETNPKELESYFNGKDTLSQWFFGQVMRAARGKANPQVVRDELDRQLLDRKTQR
jgi:aspartyl-tRNA(Asn)/glutamyl-tRNA(Gln) amidotransferase subunit B